MNLRVEGSGGLGATETDNCKRQRTEKAINELEVQAPYQPTGIETGTPVSTRQRAMNLVGGEGVFSNPSTGYPLS